MRLQLSIVLVFLAMLGNVFSQGVTTGSLTGKVTDAKTKQALQGATVVAIHVPTGGKYGAIARKGGLYTIRGMRVGGPYKVTATFVGYQATIKEGITISLGETVELDLGLSQKDKVSDAVVVTAEKDRIFNENKTGSGSTVTENEIAASPSINRSISDIARVNPYANQSTTFGGDDGLQGVSITGVNSRFNSVQIDGAVANDMFGLGTAGTPGSQANANTLSLDAIQELQVNVSPYDIRQSGFTGGLVNAVTRGGTNAWSGSVFSYGRNEDLVGLSPDALRQKYSQFKDFQFGGRVGGPIIENELFFHVTTEMRLRNRPLELALNDPSALNNYAHNKEEIDAIIAVAKDRYGYDAGTSDPFVSRNNSLNILARFDWNINQDNKLQLRHNFTNAFLDRNVQRTTQIFSLTSQQNEFRSMNNSTVLQLNSIVGDNMANEFRISYNTINDVRYNVYAPFPQVKVYLGGSDYVLMGQERSSQANSLDQSQIALTNDFSYFIDNHAITIGTHNELYNFDNLFIQDYYGTYSFRDISAFRDSTPTFYQVSYANTAFTNGNLQPHSIWGMMQTAFYAMDDWKVTPELKLSYGLRVDVPIYLDTPLENPTFASRYDSLYSRYNNLTDSMRSISTQIPMGLATSKLPNAALLWSPRIGFNYDVSGEKTFVIRGGTGLFTGKVAAVWISNQYGNTGVDVLRYSIGRDNTTSAPITAANGQPLRTSLNASQTLKPGDGILTGSAATTTGINVMDPEFKNPQVWRSTLGTDIKITDGISFTVEGMYGALRNQVDYRNLNLKRSGIMPNSKVDGRPLYAWDPAGTTDSNNAKEFTQVIYLSSRNEGYQYSIMGTLNLSENNQLLKGLSGMFSYVFGHSYDLSDATNAVANTNWQNTDSYDPNNVNIARSNFDVPHKFTANLSYRFELIEKGTTTIGLFYSGNSGRPYGFTYLGDANGDGVTHNDAVYIPKPEDFQTKIHIVPASDASELRTAEQIWQQMMTFIDANPVLKSYQGKVLERNAMREPFIHQLDLRLSQKVPLEGKQNIEVSVDFQNLLNLLNSDWGLQQYVNFQSNNTVFVLRNNTGESPYDAQGRLKMTFNSPVTNGRSGIYLTDNFFSRWRMQLGLRFNF
ncbi:MAG: TonB-dependent receptor [Candidatus Kapaibacterium sp.]